LQLINLVLLFIVLLTSGLLLTIALTALIIGLSRLLLIAALVVGLSGLLLIGLSGLLLIGLSGLIIGLSRLLLIGLSRLLIAGTLLIVARVSGGRLDTLTVVGRSREANDRRLAASALLDSAETLSSALGGSPGVLHAEIISDSSGLVTSTLLDGTETLSSTLGGSLNVLHGHGITSHTRLLTSTLLGSAETLSNTLGSMSSLTDGNGISHLSGLGDRSVLLAINLTVITDEVGEGKLKTADGAFEAGLVIGLLDGGDRLKRIGGLSADGALCSRHCWF